MLFLEHFARLFLLEGGKIRRNRPKSNRETVVVAISFIR